MKRLLIVAMSALFVVGSASADVFVNGYIKNDGTYVAPHYRSNPDGNTYNNYSYPGNTNPYYSIPSINPYLDD